MTTLRVLATLLSLAKLLLASDNGKYYVCDTGILASDNQCIFALTGDQPDDWLDAVEHDINRDVGADFYRGVQSYDGETMLSVSPKPWVNGDSLVASNVPITGDLWSYALIFELMAPLRDMMMYDPNALTSDVWAKYTRALTDCNSKTVDYDSSARGGGTPWSSNQVYEYMMDPNGIDIHHYILQYLEEGSIDLVCLSTDLNMEHCDGTREVANAVMGVDHCNCWFDAYNALYGECPKFDTTFTACSGTVASVDCADAVPQDTSNLDDETEEVTTVEPVEPTSGAPPVVPTSGAPPDGPPNGGSGNGGKGRAMRRFFSV